MLPQSDDFFFFFFPVGRSEEDWDHRSKSGS